MFITRTTTDADKTCATPLEVNQVSGVGTNFGVGTGEARPEGPKPEARRAGVGFWGGAASPTSEGV